MAVSVPGCICSTTIRGTALAFAPASGGQRGRRGVTTHCSAAERRKCLGACIKGAAAAAAVSGALLGAAAPGLATLNKFEEAAGGEFGSGTALQYGSSEADGRSFDGEDLRRANFTSASLKHASFKKTNLQGAYFIKAVAYQTDFSGADLSDVLMDRAVMNEANLDDAILERAVFTRSDLTDSKINGADFSNALLDKPMQLKLCKYAEGKNSVTGVSTRESLGCGSRRRFRESVPSSQEGAQVKESDKEAFRSTLPSYGRTGIGRQ